MNSVDRSRTTQISFTIRVIFVQLIGAGAVALCTVWILHFRDGFAWQARAAAVESNTMNSLMKFTACCSLLVFVFFRVILPNSSTTILSVCSLVLFFFTATVSHCFLIL